MHSFCCFLHFFRPKVNSTSFRTTNRRIQIVNVAKTVSKHNVVQVSDEERAQRMKELMVMVVFYDESGQIYQKVYGNGC